VVTKQGTIFSLNVLPYYFLVLVYRIIFKIMYVSCLVLENLDEQDVETCVSVVHGLAIVCETLTGVAILQ
jgi:hypothetical protein